MKTCKPTHLLLGLSLALASPLAFAQDSHANPQAQERANENAQQQEPLPPTEVPDLPMDSAQPATPATPDDPLTGPTDTPAHIRRATGRAHVGKSGEVSGVTDSLKKTKN